MYSQKLDPSLLFFHGLAIYDETLLYDLHAMRAYEKAWEDT
jgi:hypothetical protein